MPQAIIPIITAIAAATSIGGTIYEVAKGSGQSVDPASAAKQQQQDALLGADQQKAQQQKAFLASIGQQLPDLLSRTSGATSPEYLASVAGAEAGAPGNPNLFAQAANSLFGLPTSATETGSTSSTPGAAGSSPATASATNYFPTEAVPDFASFLPQGGGQGLSGGSA